MKIFIYILIAISVGLLIFNLTQINYDAPLTGDSTVAVISVMAAACSILMLWILLVSRIIKKKSRR